MYQFMQWNQKLMAEHEWWNHPHSVTIITPGGQKTKSHCGTLAFIKYDVPVSLSDTLLGVGCSAAVVVIEMSV